MGPALLFSTATAVSVLGWDGKVRTILSTSMPNAGIYLLFASDVKVFVVFEAAITFVDVVLWLMFW